MDENKGSVQGPTLAERVAGGMLLSWQDSNGGESCRPNYEPDPDKGRRLITPSRQTSLLSVDPLEV